MFGIAGSIAPRITRRVVYDQTVKILRQQLEVHRVIADVRVHTMRPVRIDEQAGPADARGRPEPAHYIDEVEVVLIEPPDPLA